MVILDLLGQAKRKTNSMTLEPMTIITCEVVRQWRNKDISPYRTSHFLTSEMQADFYHNVICNRDSKNRFFAVMEQKNFIGMVGLVDISFENSIAELSMVIDPDKTGKGYGEKALALLLHEGFKNMNLRNIFGECYQCNPSIKFWEKMIDKYSKDHVSHLIDRKYWNGQYYDSLYFNFNKGDFYGSKSERTS